MRTMRTGRITLRFLILLASAALLLVGAFVWWRLTPIYKANGLLVTISKPTTDITSPLRPDGYPDYFTAANELMSAGVTPEDNAVVLLLSAFDAKEIDANQRPQLFRMLGISEPAGTETYYADFEADLKRRGIVAPANWQQLDYLKSDDPYCVANRDYDKAGEQIWKSSELPSVAAWLDKYEPQIELIAEATRRPRYYFPVVPTRASNILLINALSVRWIIESREVCRALSRRALRRIGEGDVNKGLDDLLASHRFARLLAQRPFRTDHLVAVAIEGVARFTDEIVLQEGNLTREQVAKLRQLLTTLGPLPSQMNNLNTGERWSALEAVCLIAQDPPSIVLLSPKVRPDLVKVLPLLKGRIGWDSVLITMNQWFDRFVADISLPPAEQNIAIEKAKRDLVTSCTCTLGAGDVKCIFSSANANQIFTATLVEALISGIPNSIRAENRGRTEFDELLLALSLELYRHDHSSYPEKIADLVPDYESTIPNDAFAGRPLQYIRAGNGYRLYSFGVNGRDDGGKTYGDGDGTVDYDDIGIAIGIRKAAEATTAEESP
jgi:hypothetical protein